MTKVDEACPLVGKDLQNVYHSFYIQKKTQELSATLGMPLSCVLSVKNYSQEIEVDVNTDILLLSALDQMLNYADSFFENQMDDHSEEGQEHYASNPLPRPTVATHETRPQVV